MPATSSLQLGRDLQRISQSLTFQHFLKLHPQMKVGFAHDHDGRVLFTLKDAALGNKGVIRYADTAQQLIEVAHDVLLRAGEIEVL